MPGQVWEVIGGGANHGILVRKSRSTVSPAEAARLATGARIQELALDGERLRYKLLEGAGPETGWVSVSVKERGSPPKELVVRVAPLGDAPDGVLPQPVPDGGEAAEAGSGEPTRRRVETAPVGADPLGRAGEQAARDAVGGAASQPRPLGGEAASGPCVLPQELPENCLEAKLLRKGARQFKGVFCRPEDETFFEALRVELLRVELDQDRRIKETEAANFMKFGAVVKKPHDAPHRGLAWYMGKRCPMHTWALNKMAELTGVDGLAWWTNLYEDASVDCKFHHDWSSAGSDADRPDLKPELSMIASFGAGREFTLRHVKTGREFSFFQENGDVIAFDSEVDEAFLHGLHPAKGRGLARIAVVMVGKRSNTPKPLLPEFVGVWRPYDDQVGDLEPGEVVERSTKVTRWIPRLLQFSGKFGKGGIGPVHQWQDENGREVLAPWELAWFAERGSGLSKTASIVGPGTDAYSKRGVVKDVVVWLERAVDQGLFDLVLKNLIHREGGDRVEHVEFHLVPWDDAQSPRIPKLIRLTWKGSSEEDVQEKHNTLLARFRKDLGLLVQ